jgi:hypothetical protein
MKIFIAGSMHFAKEMLEAKKILDALGHQAYVSPDTEECLSNPDLNMDTEKNFQNDIMRACMNIQEACEALLVLNHPKNGIQGYIGAHTLIELGLAYYLQQKIFLLHQIPPQTEVRHAQEVLHMRPIILDGDILKIKEYYP